MTNLFIIAGLGNPGSRYENTRHNVGFDVIDLLAKNYDINVSKSKFKSLIGEGNIEGHKVILIKPQTFMNLSGEALKEVIDFYKIPLSNFIVIYDDVDLKQGQIRIKPKGSAGTHNGMRSVIQMLNSEDFSRVRIGIGRPPVGWDMADFVLSKIDKDSRKELENSILSAKDAVFSFITKGIDITMNTYNRE